MVRCVENVICVIDEFSLKTQFWGFVILSDNAPGHCFVEACFRTRHTMTTNNNLSPLWNCYIEFKSFQGMFQQSPGVVLLRGCLLQQLLPLSVFESFHFFSLFFLMLSRIEIIYLSQAWEIHLL